MTIALAPDYKPVPGPSSWFPGATFLKFRRDPLKFFTETHREFGDIAKFNFGPQQIFLVSHPDWIEDVLVTSAKKFQKGVALQRAKRLLGEGLLTSEGQAHLTPAPDDPAAVPSPAGAALRRRDGEARAAMARVDRAECDDRRDRARWRR